MLVLEFRILVGYNDHYDHLSPPLPCWNVRQSITSPLKLTHCWPPWPPMPTNPSLKTWRGDQFGNFSTCETILATIITKMRDRSDHCATTASPISKPRRPAFIFWVWYTPPPIIPSLAYGGGWVLGHHNPSIAQNAIWKASTASHNVCKWVQMLLSGATSTLLIRLQPFNIQYIHSY